MRNTTVTNNDYRYFESDEEELDLSSVPLGVFIFLCLFFFLWNALLAGKVMDAFVDIAACRCTENIIVLIFPHWLVGIAIPVLIGLLLGPSYFAMICFISVILPYAFWIRIKVCKCTSSGGVASDTVAVSGSPQNNEVTNLESRVTTGSDASTPSSALELVEEGRGSEIFYDVLHCATVEEDERFEGLLSRLLLRKVVEASIRSRIEVDDVHSFRALHPKTDIRVPKQSGRKDEVDLKCDVNSSMDVECPICLENFKENETVCWSRNPECHHAFHLTCAFSWLKENNDCPICRRPYVLG